MAAWKSGSLADKIKGQATSPLPQTPPAPSPAATVVAPQESHKTTTSDRKPQVSPAPQGAKPHPKDAVQKHGPGTPEPKAVDPAPEPAAVKEEKASPPTPPPELKTVKEDKEGKGKGKTEAKPIDEPPTKAAAHGPAAVAAVDVVKDEPAAAKAAPATGKPEPHTGSSNGPVPTEPAPAPARPIESDEPLVTLPTNIATLVDKKFSFVGAIAPPPAPVVPIMPQPTKRSVEPVNAPPFAAPAYSRPAGQIPPNYDTYQQQYAHQGYPAPNPAPMYGQAAYQPGYAPNYGYAPRGGRGGGAYQTGLFNLPPYERGFRGGYGGPAQSYNSYRGNAHYAAPPYYANGYRAPEEAEGPQ